jgi:hypothetical protein
VPRINVTEYVEELLNQADDIEILEEDEERRRQVRGKQWQEKQRNKLVAKEIQVSLSPSIRECGADTMRCGGHVMAGNR